MKGAEMNNKIGIAIVLGAVVFIVAGAGIGAWYGIKQQKEARESAAIAVISKPVAEAAAQNVFPAEKILTISAEVYCENAGKKISDYDMVGVVEGPLSIFIKAIPQGTEVVVSFEMGSNVYAGTALMPKDR